MGLKQLAMEIAENAHAGQIDKAGEAYLKHPIQVASAFEDEKLIATALLHDVIEDTNYSAGDLLALGIAAEVVEAVSLLSKPEQEDYFDYIKRVKENPLAKAVKQEDLKHNMDLSRIKNPKEKDFKRLEKYQKAYEILVK